MPKWILFFLIALAATAEAAASTNQTSPDSKCNLNLSGVVCGGSLQLNNCDCKCCYGSVCNDCFPPTTPDPTTTTTKTTTTPSSSTSTTKSSSTKPSTTTKKRPALSEFCDQICSYMCGTSKAFCMSSCSYREPCVSFTVNCGSGAFSDVICDDTPTTSPIASPTTKPTTTRPVTTTTARTTTTKKQSLANYCDNICQNVCGMGSCNSNCKYTDNGAKVCVSYTVNCGFGYLSSEICESKPGVGNGNGASGVFKSNSLFGSLLLLTSTVILIFTV